MSGDGKFLSKDYYEELHNGDQQHYEIYAEVLVDVVQKMEDFRKKNYSVGL